MTTDIAVFGPCPFCGTVPQIEHVGNNHTKTRKVVVRCPSCRVQRTDAGIRLSSEELEEIARGNWNQRQPVQQMNEPRLIDADALLKKISIDRRHWWPAGSAYSDGRVDGLKFVIEVINEMLMAPKEEATSITEERPI